MQTIFYFLKNGLHLPHTSTRMGIDESAGKVGVASGTRVDNLYTPSSRDKSPAAMVRIHLLVPSRIDVA